MSGIRWVSDLPPAGSNGDAQRRREAEQFAAELKDRPLQWAIYPFAQSYSAARATSSRINLGRISTFAKGYEAVQRGGSVYVRYIGQ